MPTTSQQKFQKRFVVALASFVLGMLTACTPDRASSTDPTLTAGSAATAASKAAVSADVCTADDLAIFERNDGDAVDLEREQLPRGLYLATISAMLIDRKTDSGPPLRILVREAAGGKGEVTCAEGTDKLNPDFETSLTGLVKFQIDEKAMGTGLVSRQFYVYQDKNGFGATFSNPHLQAGASPADVDLKHLLKGSAQLVRLTERSYLIKYSRERDGVRSRLVIHLDMIPQ